MAIQKDGYYYNYQLNNYILQFMAIFSGLQVQVGSLDDTDPRLISVPIHYGTSDRVVAAIMAENTQNKPLRLPTMSATLKAVQMATHRMAGTGVERRNTYTPVGGLVPADTRVIHQRRAVPYDLTLELSIYVSNVNQYFQIIEQILPLFDPQLNIQTSDELFDMTRLTHVVLTDIRNDTNQPIGIAPKVLQHTLTFNMPIYLDIPAEVRQDFIHKIFMRIGAVSSSATTSLDMVSDLDAQNIPYELVKTTDDLTVK